MKTSLLPVAAALMLSACVATVNSSGTGGAATAPHDLAVQRVAASGAVPDGVDVIIAEAAEPITITLPRARGGGRTITVRAFGGGEVVLRAAAGEVIDRAATFALEPDDMVTVISDRAGGWTIIAASDL